MLGRGFRFIPASGEQVRTREIEHFFLLFILREKEKIWVRNECFIEWWERKEGFDVAACDDGGPKVDCWEGNSGLYHEAESRYVFFILFLLIDYLWSLLFLFLFFLFIYSFIFSLSHTHRSIRHHLPSSLPRGVQPQLQCR